MITILLIASGVLNIILVVLFAASLRKVKAKEIEIQSLVGSRPDDRKFTKSQKSNLVGSRPNDR